KARVAVRVAEALADVGGRRRAGAGRLVEALLARVLARRAVGGRFVGRADVAGAAVGRDRLAERARARQAAVGRRDRRGAVRIGDRLIEGLVARVVERALERAAGAHAGRLLHEAAAEVTNDAGVILDVALARRAVGAGSGRGLDDVGRADLAAGSAVGRRVVVRARDGANGKDGSDHERRTEKVTHEGFLVGKAG